MHLRAHRLGGRLLLLANLGAANAAAAAWVVAAVRPGALGLDLAPTGLRWPGLLVGGALLLANLLWLVRRSARPADAYLESRTANGPVRVAREAVVLALRHAGAAVPDVTRLRIALDAPRGRVRVRGEFHCAEGSSNLAVAERLRQALRERFAAMVRLPDGAAAEIELVFAGFHGKLDRTLSDAQDALAFRGPEYPIDDDDTKGGKG